MEGGYFLSLHSTFKSAAMGNGSPTSCMLYHAREKAHNDHGSNSTGKGRRNLRASAFFPIDDSPAKPLILPPTVYNL
jgi:hypothetical protein